MGRFRKNGKMISGTKKSGVRGQGSGVRGLALNYRRQAKKEFLGPTQTASVKRKKKIWPNDSYCPQ